MKNLQNCQGVSGVCQGFVRGFKICQNPLNPAHRATSKALITSTVRGVRGLDQFQYFSKKFFVLFLFLGRHEKILALNPLTPDKTQKICIINKFECVVPERMKICFYLLLPKDSDLLVLSQAKSLGSLFFEIK